MKKVSLTILAFIGCFLMSCTFDGKIECFGPETQSDFSIYTGFDYDSIHIYLGTQRVCYGDMGGYDHEVYCKTSLDSGYKFIRLESGGFMSDSYGVDINGREKCLMTDVFPPLFYFFCSFNGARDGIDVQISTLTIEVFHNGFIEISKMENFAPSGEASGFIPVDDPVILLDTSGVTSSKIKIGLLNWRRIGCNNEWCLFRDSFVKNEFCYDKDD